VTDIFALLADETRRGILQILRDREASGASSTTVPTLVETLGVSRQSVNRHLALLADAGLVAAEEDDAPERRWALHAAPLEAVEDWLAPFLAPGARDGGTAVLSAWSGVDVGETIGRAVAGRSFQVRSVLHDAQAQVTELASRLPQPIRRRVRKGR
jgi:ArsR family transcriptional regulator, arsenate/arsenite/antimonite-responsive transcriptional repressor